MPTYPRSPEIAPRARASRRTPEIDGFGAWISFLVVFASVMAVVVVWHNLNDHAYTLTASVGTPVHIDTNGAAVADQ
jgi:hypothetical protein